MADNIFNEGQGEQPQTVEQMLAELLDAQRQHREEVSQLREELAKTKAPAPQVVAGLVKSPEQLREERFAEIREHSHYCPGCGALSTYPRQCFGRNEAPHQAIEMVSTEELLSGDESQHTPAPATHHLG